MASFLNKAKSKLHEHSNNKQQEPLQDQSTTANSEETQPHSQPSSSNTKDQPTDPNRDQSTLANTVNPSKTDSDESTSALDVHNTARSAKSCSHLTWSPQLASEASSYAHTLADKNKMEHSGVSGQGENLYMSTGSASFSDAVQSWLDEKKYYGGEKVGEGEFGKWGHFCESCHYFPLDGVGRGAAPLF